MWSLFKKSTLVLIVHKFWVLDFHVEVKAYAFRRFPIFMYDYFRSLN